MCRLIGNSGLGPKLNNIGSVLSETGWFATNQWTLEIIFHNRMMQYDCLTTNYSQSTAVYIPFYIGLDIARYLWEYDISTRDSLTSDLIHWLRARPEWAARGGKDHFLVLGRTTWDFQRTIDEDRHWGGKFLTLPESKNMTIVMIEACLWSENEFAIPYPTYFHPLRESEVVLWQEKVRSMKRKWLFSFVGARRPVQERRVNIQDVLLGYSEEQVREMREEVIRMIPRLVYKDPRNKSESFQDAFDVAVDGVIKRIREN
ncbi:hypothetical protein LUZ60_015274 [Juncus effusus]|nr:hypothetical protein LUZ60_015274 [Juncus effusus]